MLAADGSGDADDGCAVGIGRTKTEAWLAESMRPAAGYFEGRWYAANTREPIRDETLREGLVRMGAVKEREGLPTTSPRPRYAIAERFAHSFDSGMMRKPLHAPTQEWRTSRCRLPQSHTWNGTL